LAPSPNGNGYRERFNTAQALNGVPEGQRDQMLFKLACKIRNADVPQEIAQSLVLEAAKNCQPPFSEKIALEKISRAYSKYSPSEQRASNQTGQPELWPQFLTARDILQAPKDPTRWILDGCLPTAGGSLVVAKPKVGKSTTIADLCICVVRGEPFLGRATQQGPVAYLFLDGPLPEIADVFVSLGLRESDPIYLHAGSPPADSIDWLLFTVKQKGVKLVIIDTLQKLLKFKDINDYSEVTNRMEPLLDAARQGNCHVMMLHHAGKYAADDLDAGIGSTAIRGLCYTYLFLKRLPKSDRRIISSDQRGGRNFPETAIGFNRLTKRIEVQGTMEQAEIEEADPKILEFIKSQDREVTEREVLQAVSLRAIIISKALRKLFKNGIIERTGKGRKGSPFQYSMAMSLVDSLLERGGMGERDFGRESQKDKQGVANAEENLFPQHSEAQGKGIEKNSAAGDTGTKSDDGWEIIE
jgi:hypothetical protein